MCYKKLCSDCKTGRELLELDRKDVICPYILSYKNGHCGFYIKDSKSVKIKH